MSNPIDEETKAEMQEKIQETMTTFGANYTNSFKNALIAHCQEEADDSEYQLIDAPLATEPLKSDFMIKLGAVRKNWKKRWFVAYNEADNFVIKYYATQAMKKLKGEISLCGYEIRDFTDDEKKKDGDGLVLMKGTAREWKIRCVPDTPEKKAEWREVLQGACNKASPPIGANDKVAGEAFMGAYNATRSAHEIECAENCTGSEEEALTDLVTGAINSIIDGILEKIPDGPTKNMSTGIAKKFIATAVKTAVLGGWKGMTTAMAGTRPILETGIKSALGPIAEGKKTLCDKASEACSSIFKPVMDKAVDSRLKPVLEKISAPVSAGYVQAVKFFAEKAKEVRDKTKADGGSLDTNVKAAYWDAWLFDIDALEPLLEALGSAGDALGDFPAADIVVNIRDQMKILIKKGLSTMADAISGEGKKSPDEAYAETLGKVINDAKIFIAETMTAVLAGLIKPMFDGEVKPLCLEPIEPLNEMIPEAVKAFITIDSVVEDLLDTVIDTAIAEIVKPVADGELAKLDELATSLA